MAIQRLSRKSISSPLWKQIAAETELVSQNTQTISYTHRIIPAKYYICYWKINTQSILINTAFSFGFHFLHSIIGTAHQVKTTSGHIWEFTWIDTSRPNNQVSADKCIWCQSMYENRLKSLKREKVWSTWCRVLESFVSPSKRRGSESILSLYPAWCPTLVFLWKRGKKTCYEKGAHVSGIYDWKDWD